MSALPPFSCSFTPNVPELLQQLNCSLAISTFQAGKLLMLSAKNNEELVQLPRTFDKIMGVALSKDHMALACPDEVVLLKNSNELAKSYPKTPNTYDRLFVPRATFYTGMVDIHDLHFGKNNQLFAVNTSFSCLCTIDATHSFKPIWKPSFISQLASEDRCHLNGLAMLNGQPKYVSALGAENSKQSWRSRLPKGGIILDVQQNESNRERPKHATCAKNI